MEKPDEAQLQIWAARLMALDKLRILEIGCVETGERHQLFDVQVKDGKLIIIFCN